MTILSAASDAICLLCGRRGLHVHTIRAGREDIMGDMKKAMMPTPQPQLRIGAILYVCETFLFGGSHGPFRIEAIGSDWIVVRDRTWNDPHFQRFTETETGRLKSMDEVLTPYLDPMFSTQPDGRPWQTGVAAGD